MKSRTVAIWIAAIFLSLALTGASAWAESNGTADSGDALRFKLYHTKPGDTLWKIAADPGIYDDPWKWPLIYYYNRDVLKELGVAPTSLAIHALPPYDILAYLPQSEAARHLPGDHDTHRYWVLNVFSSPVTAEVDHEVIRLIDADHFAYLTHTVISGKKWHRVRIGFFPDKPSAQQAGIEMEQTIGLKDYWTVMASRDEVREYWGFKESPE